MYRVISSGVASALVAIAVSCYAAAGAVAAPESEDPAALNRASIPKCPAPEVETDVGESRTISLKCEGLNKEDVEIVRGPKHGDVPNDVPEDDRIRYRPDRRYTGPDHFVIEREVDGSSFRSSVRIQVGDLRGLDCEDEHAIARSDSAVEVRIRCVGRSVRTIDVARGPLSGELDQVDRSERNGDEILTARYSPDAGFSGQEAVVVEASGGDQSTLGSIGISVLPWRMRAMGDSVSAGFGFMSDGTPMTSGQIFGCRPPANLNNRCSSNSDNVPNSTADPEWSKDFGLGNNIAWSAQFANSITPNGNKVTAPDVFQNVAVTGSAPTDWLPGGPFNSQLQGIIKENPELVAMTLGANPLLSTILFGNGAKCGSEGTTVAALQACIQPFFQQVDLTGNLQKVYTALLNGADDSTVVAFQYSISDPWFTNFKNWQIETMIDFFNAQIATAVANTKQALPEEASRLILIESQVEPGNPQPTKLPRFNIGLPPVSEQTWTATFDCGTGQLVDGPSHQSASTQSVIKNGAGFCSGDPWVISADTGIHPNAEGYKQYAQTLSNVLAANNLLPPNH